MKISHKEDSLVTGEAGRTAVSSLWVHKSAVHWRITVFNRGGNSGALVVSAKDGQYFVDQLIPPQYQVIEP